MIWDKLLSLSGFTSYCEKNKAKLFRFLLMYVCGHSDSFRNCAHFTKKKKSCLVFTIALDVVTIVVIISHLTKKEMKFKE